MERGHNELTSPGILEYLLQKGLEETKMPGTIRTKEKCPICGDSFTHVPRLGLICEADRTQPTRYFIDLSYKGSRIKIYSSKNGRSLDSYGVASETLDHIRYEMRGNSFDPHKYVAADLRAYWANELLERFLNHKIEAIAPSYQRDYRRMIKKAQNHFKTKDVRDIKKLDIIEYKTHLDGSGIAPKTVKNTLDLFKTFLRWCQNDIEIIDTVPKFPQTEGTEYRFKWLSQDDQAKAFNAVPEHDKDIIGFLMLHGCRPSEARALKVKDADLETRTITIAATFSARVYREKRKGKLSKAVTIPIHSEMLDYIEKRVRSSHPEAWLFPNRKGDHYTENALRRAWGKVRSELGLDKSIRLYDATRHSFGTNLANADTSIFKVSKLMGHSSVKMTEKYTHRNVDSLRADLNKMSLKKKATVPKLSPRENLG